MRLLFHYFVAGSMIVFGVIMLCFLPMARAVHAEMERAGKLTAEEARHKQKTILAGGVLAIAVGVVLLLVVILRP
jgi:hypothetical protein